MAAHDRTAGAHGPIRIAVITVSDTRIKSTDASGAAIRALCEAAGHRIVDSRILPDESAGVGAALAELVSRKDVDAVILTGGTGISARDRTTEAVVGVLEQRLEGFGELFRALSFQQIGPAAMLSRAVGGIARGKPVFSLPGSEKAVRLGVERLILPELDHILSQLRG